MNSAKNNLETNKILITSNGKTSKIHNKLAMKILCLKIHIIFVSWASTEYQDVQLRKPVFLYFSLNFAIEQINIQLLKIKF